MPNPYASSKSSTGGNKVATLTDIYFYKLNGFIVPVDLFRLLQIKLIPKLPLARHGNEAFRSKKLYSKGGSPSLVVMRGDSCSKGHEFESRQHILDEHFTNTYLFVVKKLMCF